MAKVSLKRCSYEPSEARRAVAAALASALGEKAAALRGKRILLKPNLAIAWSPDRAATTHPEIVGAAIDYLRSAGAEVSVGDSPAGAVRGVKRVWDATGMTQMCEARGATLVNFEAGGWVECSVDGRTYRIAKAILDFDHVISLPKFKTHVLTLITGAVKNTFGWVPGLDKSRFHLYNPRPAAMSKILADVFSIAAPVATLVDAVDAMEGNGPSSGRVRHLGFIAAGGDAVALDAVLADLVGIEPMKVPTTREAWRRGLGEGRLDHIDLEGDNPGDFTVGGFDVPTNWQFSLVPNALVRALARWFWVRPVVNATSCVGCGDCVRGCPASAIGLDGGKAVVTYAKCVACLCCIEVCPAGAIDALKSTLARLVT
ncbi:MAG TPA: DUF362 domain-containing protein [bacterium]|nr:DUF362 domain-containing protein [bacterium]